MIRNCFLLLVNSGVLDIVFAIDTSGSNVQIIDFILTVVENLEISASKTRVGALIFSGVSTDIFDLKTYSTKQDVWWALKQIARSGVFSSSTTTDIASAFQMLVGMDSVKAATHFSVQFSFYLIFCLFGYIWVVWVIM